jgi:hypothetical protein
MYTIKTPEYESLLPSCYDVKQPLFVAGGPGIGKSAIPRQVFKKIAEQENRKFVEWADLSLKDKQEALEKPEEFWIFADMRTSQMDTMSLVGIPNMANTEMLENIPYSWVIYFTNPESRGCIFFDEINLAAPIVQSITYSAIHDRVISDRRIADDIYVFAAGNRAEDKAHTFDMPLPLRDRFAECEVAIDVEAWLSWAQKSKVNPHLISFINWKPSNLYNADKVKAEKPATPRGIERASRLLGDADITDDKSHMLTSISCGESFATEFEAYCKVYRQLDWNDLLKTPSKVKDLPLDQQYAISAGLVDRFKRVVDAGSDKNNLTPLFDVADHLREDFAVFSYRMMSGLGDKMLVNAVKSIGRQATFAKKYAKYLLDNV